MENKKWKSYAKIAREQLLAVVVSWNLEKNNKDIIRSITRCYYNQVHSVGLPNQTGFISENAYKEKLLGKPVVDDHYLSPQFIGRMIMDHPDKFLYDTKVFNKIFFSSCATIKVTSRENDLLSTLTRNDGVNYSILVPTDQKYESLGINLLKKPKNKHLWKDAVKTNKKPQYPDYLLEYEKQFLNVPLN